MSGPMPLGDLHWYQAEIIDELAPIIGSRGTKARAKVSLPTGAGKTRVAVEAAVKYVLAADARTSRPELPPSLEQLRQGVDRAQDLALVGRKS